MDGGDVAIGLILVVGGIAIGVGIGFAWSTPFANCEGYAAGSGLTCKVMERSCWCEDESGAWREAEQ